VATTLQLGNADPNPGITEKDGAGVTGDDNRAVVDDPSATDKALAAAAAARRVKEEGVADPDNKETKETGDQTRPEWMEEKFWTGDLAESSKKQAAAYAEAQKKIGKPDDALAEAKAKAAEAGKGEALEVLIQAASTEYSERNGSIAAATYDKFNALGITPKQVNDYIEGRQATADKRTSDLTELAGGVDDLKAAMEWAEVAFDEDEKAEFNAAVNGEGKARSQNAIRVMMARFAEEGKEPSRITGEVVNRGGSRVKPFRSMEEQRAAQNDPRYSTDPAYQQEVYDRIEAGSDLY